MKTGGEEHQGRETSTRKGHEVGKSLAFGGVERRPEVRTGQ